MSDIVERLRSLVYQEEWLEEAAAEIERLRAENELLRSASYVLSAEEWDAFQRELDCPKGPNEKLKQLFRDYRANLGIEQKLDEKC
jgi:uncharacterized protein (DUF1778 family)